MSGKTEQQLQNLREALIWWQSVPEAAVLPNLVGWSKETKCGTLACFGGHCIRRPELVAQGLRQDAHDGWPILGELGGLDVAEHLFGDWCVWAARRDHPADEGFTGTDHALVTNRLRWALEH